MGFYWTALIYSKATLAQNEVELFNFKRMYVPSSSTLPSQVVIGYTLISTFFLHSSLWEGLAREYFSNMFSYLFLFLFLISSYVLRIVEISFTLTALISIVQVALEFTRCCFICSSQDSIVSKLYLTILYLISFTVSVAVYIVVIPLTFIIPFGLKIMTDYPNILFFFLFANVLIWLIMEIYHSVLYKFVNHWFYHPQKTEADDFLYCTSGLLECSLFRPRDDVSYNLQIIKKEIKARQAKMMSMRKPKNKGMLIQTLKCMVAIKRKLSEKRRSESSDSDSEKSDDGNNDKNVSIEEENCELLSDQDEDDDSQDSVGDSETTLKKQSEESEQKEESEIEDVDSQSSGIETETENCTKASDEYAKLPNDSQIDLKRINQPGDDNTDKHDRAPNVQIINKEQISDTSDNPHFEGEDSSMQVSESSSDFNNKNSTALLKGDSNADNNVTQNEDNTNNNMPSFKTKSTEQVSNKCAKSDKSSTEISSTEEKHNNKEDDIIQSD
ncbi:hypothetical protein NQ315_012195 [Exocentrus adspersus]|uniref:Uncharacterized protein n=1 Tax=Exocentrus adspersus TaxID=1586481 RepID=A0AAV8VZ94_9CUCU|nr:hypothetical protein NQ315_012195 [Exocentrus adspersus]